MYECNGSRLGHHGLASELGNSTSNSTSSFVKQKQQKNNWSSSTYIILRLCNTLTWRHLSYAQHFFSLASQGMQWPGDHVEPCLLRGLLSAPTTPCYSWQLHVSSCDVKTWEMSRTVTTWARTRPPGLGIKLHAGHDPPSVACKQNNRQHEGGSGEQ